jgi:hypothetical protein
VTYPFHLHRPCSIRTSERQCRLPCMCIKASREAKSEFLKAFCTVFLLLEGVQVFLKMPNLATYPKLQVILKKQQPYALFTTIYISSHEPASSVVSRLKASYFSGSSRKRILFAIYRIITSQILVVSTTDLSSVSLFNDA